MTIQQKASITAGLTGTPGAVLVVEGFPISGKTTSMAVMVIQLLPMVHRVLIVSQSTDGADALFEGVVKLLGRRKDGTEVLPKCMRLWNGQEEWKIAQLLNDFPHEVDHPSMGSELAV